MRPKMSYCKRIIYPIGQGAFYAEIIDETYTFIYDCGTESLQILIDDAINDFIKNDLIRDVDGLFISHFHHDHISGIPKLIDKLKNKSRKIKRIFIPKLTTEQRILNLIDLATYGYDFHSDEFKLVNNYEDYFNNINDDPPHIINILPEANNEASEIIDINFIDKKSDYQSETRFNFSGWLFIPFNYQDFDQVNYDSFMSKSGLTELDFKDIDDNKWNKIKKAGLSIKLQSNENSMVLYSCAKMQYDFLNGLGRHFHCRWRNGAIYLGDYPTRNNVYTMKLVQFLYKHYAFFNAQLVQISHHGSEDDFTGGVNNLYLNFRSCRRQEFFVCYGSPNKHSHPYPDIRAILGETVIDITNQDYKLIRFF